MVSYIRTFQRNYISLDCPLTLFALRDFSISTVSGACRILIVRRHHCSSISLVWDECPLLDIKSLVLLLIFSRKEMQTSSKAGERAFFFCK